MIDLETLRARTASGGDTDELPVTRRFLRRLIDELGAGRQAVAELAANHAREGVRG